MRAVFLVVGLLLLTFVVPPAFRGVGRWLIVQDPLVPAQAVFVHAGHIPFRAMEAAALYRQGWATEVWLAAIVPTPEHEALRRLGVERPQGWFYSRQVLEQMAVPPDAIRVLDQEVLTTRDEVEVVAGELRRTGGKRVILITSKQHTRRVGMLWRALGDDSLEAVVRYAESDPFDPHRWWHNSRDAQAVAHEVFGIFNTWIGSPLRPDS